MSVEDAYYVYVDSNNRITGTSSNFTYNMALPTDHDFTHVTLLNALIPKSYYLIQAGYNTFQLQEGATIVTVSLPVGNYLLNVFKSTVATALTAASPNGWTYSVSYPAASLPDTGKFTYSVVGNASQPSLIFGPVLYEPFGFLPGSTNVFVANSLISATVINLGAETRLIIHSNLVNNPNVDNNLISINAANSIPYSTISYINYAPEYRSHKLNSKNINSANFSLTNEAGILLDLNGLNMNLTVMFYRKDNINDVVRNYVKMRALKNNSH